MRRFVEEKASILVFLLLLPTATTSLYVALPLAFTGDGIKSESSLAISSGQINSFELNVSASLLSDRVVVGIEMYPSESLWQYYHTIFEANRSGVLASITNAINDFSLETYGVKAEGIDVTFHERTSYLGYAIFLNFRIVSSNVVAKVGNHTYVADCRWRGICIGGALTSGGKAWNLSETFDLKFFQTPLEKWVLVNNFTLALQTSNVNFVFDVQGGPILDRNEDELQFYSDVKPPRGSLSAMPPVKEQGDSEACSAFASSTAIEWWQCGKQCDWFSCTCTKDDLPSTYSTKPGYSGNTGKTCGCIDYHFSEQYLYDRARYEEGDGVDGDSDDDKGVWAYTVCDVAKDEGVCVVEDCPGGDCSWHKGGCIDHGANGEKCSDECGASSCAATHKISDYVQLTSAQAKSYSTLKSYIDNHGILIWWGRLCDCYVVNGHCNAGCGTPPLPGLCSCILYGSHTRTLYGYSSSHIYTQDSQGTDWGDNGRGSLCNDFFPSHVFYSPGAIYIRMPCQCNGDNCGCSYADQCKIQKGSCQCGGPHCSEVSSCQSSNNCKAYKPCGGTKMCSCDTWCSCSQVCKNYPCGTKACDSICPFYCDGYCPGCGNTVCKDETECFCM